ncbi:hypothetical protein [Agromyces sp. SYSU T00194]|uniref:hypothetical protein n=1 Tax=Agromyces chitinivorans TaxID=3158560 RepID=UPI003390AD50
MTTGIALVNAREGDRDPFDANPSPESAPAAGPEGRELVVVGGLLSTFVTILLVLLAALQPAVATIAIIGVVAVFATMLVVRSTVERPYTRVRALATLLVLLGTGSAAAIIWIVASGWLPA